MSNTEWGGDYIKPTVELMKVLSSKNNLLFVNSPYTVSDIASGLMGKKPVDLKSALGLKSRISTFTYAGGANVHVLTPPPGLTINFLPKGLLYLTGLKFNAWLVRLSVKKALKKLGMRENLIHIVGFNPGMGLINGRKYQEKSLIYHCYDEVSGATAWSKKHGVWLEDAFMKMIDGVVVSSKRLFENKSKMCPRCFLVKNAVKFELFSQGFHSEMPNGPVIGYVGTVDDRLDYDILQYVFAHMPQVKFVFVGRITSQRGLAILKKYPNVTVDGAKSPEELPAYLKTFSAGIIPFVKDTFTESIYPMKINEYLAAGLAVVSTDFGDIREFEKLISIANNREAFLQHCHNEMQQDTLAKKQARVAVAKQNTWEKRAEELSLAIMQIEN